MGCGFHTAIVPGPPEHGAGPTQPGAGTVNQVVARYLDGRMVKGTSLDVAPAKPTCHVRTTDQGMVEVVLADLKALYFVKTPEGNPAHDYAAEPTPGDPRLAGSHRVTLAFKDAEQMAGLVNRYPPIGDFFWVLPVDGKGNTIRVLVNRAAIKQIRADD